MSNSFRKAIVSWTTHRSPSSSILKEEKPNRYLQELQKEAENINLKNVDKVSISFDPFHSKIQSIRDILTYLTTKNAFLSNMECVVKTNILSDRSDPTLDMTLKNGNKLIYKTANLTSFEILTHMNEFLANIEKNSQKI